MYTAPVSFILPYIFLLAWELDWFEVTFIDGFLNEFIAKRIRSDDLGYYAIQGDDRDDDESLKFRELFNDIIETKRGRTTKNRSD